MEQLLGGTSAIVSECLVKVPWCQQQQPRPVPRPRDSEALQSLFCVLHSLRERLTAWYLQPAFREALWPLSCGHSADVYTGAWQGSACRLPGEVFAHPLSLECSLKRQSGSTGSLGAPFPSVGVTSTSPLPPPHPSFLPLSPQQPLSRPWNVRLFPSTCSPEPSSVFYEFLELGSSALHARATALQDTWAVLPTLATWIPVTLGHRNTHPCMSQDKVLDHTTGNGCCLMSSPALL